MLAYSPSSRHTSCLAASGAAGAGGEAANGSAAAGGAPKPDGAPEAPNGLDAAPLEDVMARLLSADTRDVGVVAAALVRRVRTLGAESVVEPATAQQLRRLLTFFSEMMVEWEDRDLNEATSAQFDDDFDELQRAAYCALWARAAGGGDAAAALLDYLLMSLGGEDTEEISRKLECLEVKDRSGRGAAVRSADLAPRLLDFVVRCKSVVTACYCLEALRILATEGGEEDRTALLDAGAVPLLTSLLVAWIGCRPRVDAVDAICRAAGIIAALAVPTEHARGRCAEVLAGGAVAGLLGLLRTAFYCSWLLETAPYVASEAEAALLALGEAHRRSGAAGPLLSANDVDSLRRIAEDDDEETLGYISKSARAAVAARLLARLA
jgi:hypothetical protein